jgi:hypothetical protein
LPLFQSETKDFSLLFGPPYNVAKTIPFSFVCKVTKKLFSPKVLRESTIAVAQKFLFIP